MYRPLGCQKGARLGGCSLTFSAQHTRPKHNRSFEAGVSTVGTSSYRDTSPTRRTRCLWCWISVSPTTVLDVLLTLVNGNLRYPNDIDRSLNEVVTDKIRKYRADCNNNPPTSVSFMPAIASTSGRLHSEFIRLLFLQDHRETDRFFAASGLQFAQSNRGLFHFRRAALFSQFLAKVGSTLAKAAALRVNLNIDDYHIKNTQSFFRK